MSSAPRARSRRRKGLRPRRLPKPRAPTPRGVPENRRTGCALTLRLTILGCGSSAGVPRVGEGWGACDPANPKNRRRRCAVLLERFSAAGRDNRPRRRRPGFPRAVDRRGVRRLDAVLLSHPHADHTHGLDDLRPLFQIMRRRLDIYMDEPTSLIGDGRVRLHFRDPAGKQLSADRNRHPPRCGRPFRLEGAEGRSRDAVRSRPRRDQRARLSLRALAYTPDVKRIPDAARPHLEDLDVWIIDALRYRPHPSHFSLDEALAEIETMRPKRAILTNFTPISTTRP